MKNPIVRHICKSESKRKEERSRKREKEEESDTEELGCDGHEQGMSVRKRVERVDGRMTNCHCHQVILTGRVGKWPWHMEMPGLLSVG